MQWPNYEQNKIESSTCFCNQLSSDNFDKVLVKNMLNPYLSELTCFPDIFRLQMEPVIFTLIPSCVRTWVPVFFKNVYRVGALTDLCWCLRFMSEDLFSQGCVCTCVFM